MDGMDGTEYEKCPSIFFILCGYIDHLYTLNVQIIVTLNNRDGFILLAFLVGGGAKPKNRYYE